MSVAGPATVPAAGPASAGAALLSTAADGRTEETKQLLAAGADVNAPNALGLTPLMLAVLGGHLDTAVQLALGGADLSLRDAEGRTARGTV